MTGKLRPPFSPVIGFLVIFPIALQLPVTILTQNLTGKVGQSRFAPLQVRTMFEGWTIRQRRR
ncbi:hypothetical protein THF5H11_210043 [Vibrio jasicida]|nr:hypothetical protein THF5H11_210043 [Vibrio jasicida]